MKFTSLLAQIRRVVPSDLAVYVVGGALRDRLLELPVRDIDFAVEGDAIGLARQVANHLSAAFYPLDAERDTGRVIWEAPDGKRMILDFAQLRDIDILSDLHARDFTINAMAVDIRNPGELIDPLNGATDLRTRQLRVCSPTSIADDPIRCLRALRLANVYELRIDPETLLDIRENAAGIEKVSPERLRDEVFRILESPKPATAVRLMEQLGILPYVFPELLPLIGLVQPQPHAYDAWTHTLNVLSKLEVVFKVLAADYDPGIAANLTLGLVSVRLGRFREQLNSHLGQQINPNRTLTSLLGFAALYHDAAKPQTYAREEDGRIRFFRHEEIGASLVQKKARRFRLSNEERERLALIIQHHMRVIWLSQAGQLPTRRAIYRFYRDVGPVGVDICLLSLADVLATYGTMLPQEIWNHHLEVVRILLEAWWEHPAEKVSPPPLISGKTLIETFGLTPGPLIGEILEAVREAQATGEVEETGQALELARALIDAKNSGSETIQG